MADPIDLVLRPVGLHWQYEPKDGAEDLCAHGKIEFRIGDESLVPEDFESSVTVSSSALYLLRSLTANTLSMNDEGEHLFPCCGFHFYDVNWDDDASIGGCPNGLDFEISRTDSEVTIASRRGQEWKVGVATWDSAVLGFSDIVSDFYAAHAPKEALVDEFPGFMKFLAEWQRRRKKTFEFASKVRSRTGA